MQGWTAGPRSGFDQAEVEETLKGSSASAIRHGVDVLNLSNQPTGEVLEVAPGGSVRWTYRVPDRFEGESGRAQVRRQATVNLVDEPPFDLYARRLLLWTEMRATDGRWVRWHQGVFVPALAPVTYDGAMTTRVVPLADLAYVWASRTIGGTGLTVAAGTVVTSYIRSSFASRFGVTSTAIPSSARVLPELLAFEEDDSWLDVYNAMLTAIGFDWVAPDESGLPRTTSLLDLANMGPEEMFAPGGTLSVSGEIAPLLPRIPNVVRFVGREPQGGGAIPSATRRNESTGNASIAGRGGSPQGEVHERVEVDVTEQAPLDEYADAVSQRLFAGGGERLSLRCGLYPRFADGDAVEVSFPALGVEGSFLVTEWTQPRETITSESSVLTTFTCEKRVTA